MRNSLIKALLLAGTYSAMAQAAFAQDAPADNAVQPADVTMGDIIVTAQFREQRLQDTPIAITAVNAEMLEARSQTNITDVANQAPSVILKPQGATFGPAIAASIRGVGQTDFNPAVEPGVGIYVDDVYYPQLTGAALDLLDLDRVEILRGPQGTLAGKNSIGGAIKLYSKKPEGDGHGYVEATYGSNQRLGMRASADFTVAQDLFARISGVFKQQDGYVDQIDYGCANPASGVPALASPGRCKIGELGGVGYGAVRAILRFAPSDGLELTVTADYTKDQRTQQGEVLLAADQDNPNTNAAPGLPYTLANFGCGSYCNFTTSGQPAGVFNAYFIPVAPGVSAPVPFAVYDGYVSGGGADAFVVPFPLIATRGENKTRHQNYGFSANLSADLTDNLNLVSITSYRELESEFDTDDDLSPANISYGQNVLTNWAFSQELRLNGKVGDFLDYTVGGFYFEQKSVYYSLQDIRYSVIPLQFVQNDPIKADTKAVFAHITAEVADGFNLSGGLRYTDESKDYTFVRTNPDGTPNLFLGSLNGQVGSFSGDNIDYRISADYRFSPALMAYANVSTGIKGGGVNPRPFHPGQVQPFGPETLTAFELGFKSDLFDRALRLNVAAFYNVYKDIQIPLIDCPEFGQPSSPCYATANAGDGKFKGIEVELFATPVVGLSIDGAVSYLDFAFDEGSINPRAGGPTNPNGPQEDDPFVNAPKWKWSLGVQYRADLDSYGSLTPRFDVAYQDRLFVGRGPSAVPGTSGPQQFIPAYTMANARLTWRNADEDLDISLEVTNLFDKYHLLSAFDLRSAGSGIYKGMPGRPREWAVTVKKSF